MIISWLLLLALVASSAWRIYNTSSSPSRGVINVHLLCHSQFVSVGFCFVFHANSLLSVHPLLPCSLNTYRNLTKNSKSNS